ncbi:hypothetical protein KJ969_05175 [Patescibacteria group bacterium]|nr:hypothetical protein [Patescibacteria group bacterium]MBU1921614.1 hypothetical protein [Patescibacteria group bacterium]
MCKPEKATVDQVCEVAAQIKSGRINRWNLQAFILDPDSVLRSQIYEVVVDYDQPLAKMIEACKLDWVNEDITEEHFPIQGNGHKKVKLELYQFDKTITGDQALKRLDEAGYRPATIEELLVFGKKYPDKQRQFPIIALASSWCNPGGHLYVPSLYGDAAGRYLSLSWPGLDFDPHYRFLVVGK